MLERFPFGKPVETVAQSDRRPKRVFVLGVYASAVHARWFSRGGRQLVRALGVASEPAIFWRGEGAAEIVARVMVPRECGYIIPADASFNGPSGRALDELFLLPLRCPWDEAWLCDLFPRSRMNASQQAAIDRHYEPLVAKGLVPEVTWKPATRTFSSAERNAEIIEELRQSRAELLVLLGDNPIGEFLAPLTGSPARLAAITKEGREYGKPFRASIGGLSIEVLALAHPRQAARLGSSSSIWAQRHHKWIRRCLTTR